VDSRSTYERDPSLFGLLARRAGTRDFCSAFAALVRPVQFFPLTIHYFTFLSTSPKKLGRQSCRLAFLLMCLWSALYGYGNNFYPNTFLDKITRGF
jgi:hypothetical protein